MPRYRGQALISIEKEVFGSKQQIENLFRQWIEEGRRLGVRVELEPVFEEIL